MEKIVNLIKLVEKYTQLVKTLIDTHKDVDREKDLKLYVRIIFLERFYYNSLAIKNILELYKNDKNFKFPLGLLLRTGLSDFLTFFYFVLIVKENFPNVQFIELEIKKFLSGNIQFLQKEIELNLSQAKITKKQHDEVMHNIQKIYSDFFDPITGELIVGKQINFSDIKKKLEKNHDLKWAALAYKAYDVFSKYEHVGALTNDLQKNHLKNNDFDMNGIIISTIFIYKGVEAIVKSMPEYIDLRKTFDELNNDLLVL